MEKEIAPKAKPSKEEDAVLKAYCQQKEKTENQVVRELIAKLKSKTARLHLKVLASFHPTPEGGGLSTVSFTVKSKALVLKYSYQKRYKLQLC